MYNRFVVTEILLISNCRQDLPCKIYREFDIKPKFVLNDTDMILEALKVLNSVKVSYNIALPGVDCRVVDYGRRFLIENVILMVS